MLLGSANLSNVGISYQGANNTSHNDSGHTAFSHCCIKSAGSQKWCRAGLEPSRLECSRYYLLDSRSSLPVNTSRDLLLPVNWAGFVTKVVTLSLPATLM